MTPDDSTSTPADFADLFDDWLAGATISKRSVPIYSKPGLYAEYEQLERDLAALDDEEQHGRELAGSPRRRILARMEALYEEHRASKSTWTVRALTDAELDKLADGDPENGVPALVKPERAPEPTKPDPLPKNADVQQAKSHTIAMNAYEKDLAAWQAEEPAYEKAIAEYADELNLRGIAASVEKIEFADGRVKDSITVDQLKQLRERLGTRQVMRLLQAAMLASAEEPVIPAPFSLSTSETDPTS